MYVIVRTDLSKPQIAVQATHAAIEIARNYLTPDQEHPSVIIVVVKNEARLLKLTEDLKTAGITFKAFREPDIDNALTAIATVPLYGDQRTFFKRFQLLRMEK